MKEKVDQSQEETMQKYQVYMEAVTRELRECKKIGVYYVKEISAGIFRLCNNGVHMELIVGKEKALLFDTGHGFGDIKDAVEQITTLPLYVVNSHGHLDHASGNSWFEQEIYIHPKDMELCRKHNLAKMRLAGLDMAKVNLELLPQFEVLPSDFDIENYQNQGCGKLIPVQEGHIFDLGRRTLRVIELPGHAQGSIGLLCPEERLLYVGDAINSGLWLFLEESESLAVYGNTLKKAMQIDFSQIVMAHDSKPMPKEVLQDFLDVAENLDFEQGLPFSSPFVPEGEEARVCLRPGKTPEIPSASIVIGKSHLV